MMVIKTFIVIIQVVIMIGKDLERWYVDRSRQERGKNDTRDYQDWMDRTWKFVYCHGPWETKTDREQKARENQENENWARSSEKKVEEKKEEPLYL